MGGVPRLLPLALVTVAFALPALADAPRVEVSVSHRVVAQYAAVDGREALELVLSFQNSGANDLVDVTVRLLALTATYKCSIENAEKAVVGPLPAAGTAEVVWAFHLLPGCNLAPDTRAVLRLDGFDGATGRPVSATLYSEGR